MSRTNDSILLSLFDAPQSASERALAARYAPIIHFDAHEPFLPLAAGYTIFRRSGRSPSFRQGCEIDLTPQGQPPASLAIEYAIWWDWDIGHLYELEHAWVFVNEKDRPIAGYARRGASRGRASVPDSGARRWVHPGPDQQRHAGNAR